MMTHLESSCNVVKPYKVHHSDNDNPWQVIETPTNQIIAEFTDSRSAKLHANQLNGGNGFRGWTPSFLFGRLEVRV